MVIFARTDYLHVVWYPLSLSVLKGMAISFPDDAIILWGFGKWAITSHMIITYAQGSQTTLQHTWHAWYLKWRRVSHFRVQVSAQSIYQLPFAIQTHLMTGSCTRSPLLFSIMRQASPLRRLDTEWPEISQVDHSIPATQQIDNLSFHVDWHLMPTPHTRTWTTAVFTWDQNSISTSWRYF